MCQICSFWFHLGSPSLVTVFYIIMIKETGKCFLSCQKPQLLQSVVVLGFHPVSTYPCMCLLHSGRRFCMLHFIYCNSVLLIISTHNWEAVGTEEDPSPANPAELVSIVVVLEHLQVFSGLSFQTSCSVRKSWCPCLRHDGDKTACPDQTGSLIRELQSSVFLTALGLGWNPPKARDESHRRRFPSGQAGLLMSHLGLDYFLAVEVDHWLGTWGRTGPACYPELDKPDEGISCLLGCHGLLGFEAASQHAGEVWLHWRAGASRVWSCVEFSLNVVTITTALFSNIYIVAVLSVC